MSLRGALSQATSSARPSKALRRFFLHREGQSLVEFALILPILLLLALIAVDFGRVYLGYVNLQNMARIASNFAANNPNAWLKNQTAKITMYQNQVLADAAATNCALNPGVPASPTFSDADGDGVATGFGDRATVSFTCGFSVITPIISSILGGTVNVTATAVFPVKSALSSTSSGGGGCLPPSPAINATPTSGALPLTVQFLDSSGGGAGTGWLWDFGDGTTSTARDPGNHVYNAAQTYIVTLTVMSLCGNFTTTPGTSITVSPATPALCVVPDFNGVERSDAQALWGPAPGAGFTTQVQPTNGNWKITSQSIVAGTSVACTSTITVGH